MNYFFISGSSVTGGLKARKDGGDKWRSFGSNINKRGIYF